MAPCTLERTEMAGSITISQYKVWQQFGGGYNIVARNGTELERIHTRSQRQADETFAMLLGKYGGELHPHTVIDLGNAAHYRSLAAESQDATNVALFTELADFYAQRAASR